MRTLSGSDTPFPGAGLPGLLVHAIAASGAVQGITIAGVGDDFPLLYANESFQRLTGYDPQEILGRNCRFLQGADTDQEQARRLGAALREQREVSVLLRNFRRDGTPFWNRVSVAPIRDDTTGRVTHFIGTQIDVTDLVESAHRSATAGR